MWCALVLVLLIAATASASPISNPQRGNAATQTDTSAQAATAGSQTPSAQPGAIGVVMKAASADGRGIKLTNIAKSASGNSAVVS
jgi:hypothetical protein